MYTCNPFNEKEFLDICHKLHEEPRIEEIAIECESDSYFNKVREAVATDRRGEVVFCVIRPNHKIITVTSEEYPEGVFRIPTGGIGHQEDILEAVFRETREELGLETEIQSFGGVLKIKFQYGEQQVMFYSYLFILREKGGRLLEDASDDEVSEVKEVDIEGLEQIAEELFSIRGRWATWGRFRHESTHAVARYLRAGFHKR